MPLTDPGWNTLETLEDLPKQLRDEIAHFFSVYKDLEQKKVTVDGWYSREEALEEIEALAQALQGEHEPGLSPGSPLGSARHVLLRGDRPRHRAGAHGVPADLEHRPPADRARVRRLGGPRRGVHGRDPARDDARRADLLPRRPVADRARLAALPARPVRRRASSTRGSAGTSILGTIPIGIFGLAFKDQIENGARDLYLIGTMLIVFGLVLLLADRVSKRERGRRVDRRARRPVGGLRAGGGAGPGRVALGRDDQRRPVAGPRPHERGALLVPAVDAGGRAERRCSSCGTSARAPAPGRARS